MRIGNEVDPEGEMKDVEFRRSAARQADPPRAKPIRRAPSRSAARQMGTTTPDPEAADDNHQRHGEDEPDTACSTPCGRPG
jgi:hypothetical protein